MTMSATFFDPASVRPHSTIGVEGCYSAAHHALENDDLQHAERLFAMMLLLRPSDERGWLGLAVIGERRGAWRFAAALYRAGSAVSRDSVRCLLGLGRALAELGRRRDAERALDEAERKTDDPAVLSAIARERARHDLH